MYVVQPPRSMSEARIVNQQIINLRLETRKETGKQDFTKPRVETVSRRRRLGHFVKWPKSLA